MFKQLTIGLAAVTVATFAVFTPVVSATGGKPAGNNGTVKISQGKPNGTPENNPHVSCAFYVEFYNYEKGNYNADVKFELQNPTKTGRTLSVKSGDLTPFIGGDKAGGGTDLDASEKYTLGFTGAAHPQQGYHVKLTIHAPESKGNDVKHKVFWVQPCDEAQDNENDNDDEFTPQVLGENTPTPEFLPVTGGEFIPVAAVSLMTSGVAYTAHSRRNKRDV